MSMKTISEKKAKTTFWVSLIGGVGALWLSWFWLHTVKNDGLSGPIWENYKYWYITFAYYAINSALLLSTAFFLKKQLYKLHSLFSIVLGLSVLGSFFIFDSSSNLFVYTTLVGMIAFWSGGVVLIPIFLFSVIKNFIFGLRYLFGRTQYYTEAIPVNINNNAQS